jgi:outer membrane autotransporter barrel domain
VEANYHAWGGSLDVEYSFRKRLAYGYSVEPLLGTVLAKLEGVDYRLSNGVTVKQDSINPRVLKAGLVGNKQLAVGNLYAKGIVYYDFSGSDHAWVELRNYSKEVEVVDWGHKAWVNAGIGCNFLVFDNGSVYVDLSKDFGGNGLRNWQANVGFKLSI